MGLDIPLTILSYFSINENSRSGLSWVKTNKSAGCLDKDGYFVVVCNNKKYRVHRIIAKILNPDKNLKNLEIDHINGVRSDNTLKNLRIVDKSTNRKNSSKRSNNKTGIVGVSITTDNKGSPKYLTACCKNNSKNIKVHFSIKKYGYDLALELAKQCRLDMLSELIAQGEPYTTRHIKGE